MNHRQNRDSPSCPQLKPHAFYQEQPRRPELIVQHLKTEKTELQDRQPYEDHRQANSHNSNLNNKSNVKGNIAMTIVLVQQNQQLISKIESVRRQIEDQQLKARIFTDNIRKNEKQIARLKQRKEELMQSQQNSLRMETLNQSQIPNKTVAMDSTLHNNTWMNEFLNKEELQSLWNTKRQSKTSKITKIQPKVKCFTIDLSTHVNTAKDKKANEKVQSKLSYSSVDQKQTKLRNQKTIERNKRSIVSVAQNAKTKTARLDLKLNLNQKSLVYNQTQKSKALNKAICTLRNAKKLKPNPQL